MTALRANSRLQVGSAPWISEERASALKIADAEAEEFTFSARNELDWLNEHMAEVFSENQINVAEIFKTPGKLRGKTPRTARKYNHLEARAPLSDIFSATPRGAPSPFRQQIIDRHAPTFQVAEDAIETPKEEIAVPQPVFTRATNKENSDSGYHGSQFSVATEVDERWQISAAGKTSPAKTPSKSEQSETMDVDSDERRTTEGSFQSAKEEQTLAVTLDESGPQQEVAVSSVEEQPKLPETKSPVLARKEVRGSPPKPFLQNAAQPPQRGAEREQPQKKPDANEVFDDVQSPSDGSSPIRPIVVRKSSLNFASLPAREPLTTKKSIGNRTSRTSHLEQSRSSYYGSKAGGKSVGGTRRDQDQDENEDSDVDMLDAREESDVDSKMARMHNKTSTQRLQDQISMLGQSQSQTARPSKSIPNLAAIASQPTYPSTSHEPRKAASPFRVVNAPGAFPEDEDSWIGPSTAAGAVPTIFSPRPAMHVKSHSTDVMDGIHGKDSVGGADFNVPKQRRDDPRHRSPLREPAIPDRTTSTLGHAKSASTSIIKSPNKGDDVSDHTLKKGISVSNPNLGSMQAEPNTPKSPSRSYRESPLKAAKDKLSSILKTSKNLFASSAAASAAAKGATFSPPPQRLGQHDAPSMEDVLYRQPTQTSLYPSLDDRSRSETQQLQNSPPKSPRKTRASTEREDKRREKEAKEAKEAQKMEQKLEKLREKESEKARQFSREEHERIATMERQVMAKKELERLTKAAQTEVPRTTRSSPRKTKAQLEAEGRAAAAGPYLDNGDVEMTDASATMASAAAPRAGPQIGKSKELTKRPVKPTEKPTGPSKQAPVVIRVDTGSQRGPRNPYHPSNATLATSLGESLSAPAQPSVTTQAGRSAVQVNQKPKPGVASTIRPKASTSSLKSVSSATGKVKALEIAAKKREEAEQEAQRKRNMKLESERKRAVFQEEKQQEQQRRDETQRQAEKQREKEHAASQIDPKKASQRAALEKKMEMERAKQQRPPPPAPRPQAVVDVGHTNVKEKPLPAAPPHRGDLGPPRPPSRLNSIRPQEDFTRSVSQMLQNTTKAPPKRPLPHEAGEESQTRAPLQRNPQSYQQPDPKRRRTGDNQDEETSESPQRGAMAPPVRQSGIKKDGPTRSLFPNGYANIPPPTHAGPSLHKATLTAQHMHQSKPAHPMDMAQLSKAAITFAPNPAQAANPSHKTPARPVTTAPGGKSTAKPSAKSSPRYQNGDSIDLPEIQTDDDDDEDDDSDHDDKASFPVPNWANSPALRAGIMRQETMDPASVFGAPTEIKLEEVFKNKERHGRFRQRTSSANWSGGDRLTEEEVARDLIARERLRREGGWSYGLS